MKERPILFSAPMVRAILEGRKTQTRRVMDVDHDHHTEVKGYEIFEFTPFHTKRNLELGIVVVPGFYVSLKTDAHIDLRNHLYRCPYGQPGDKLWVRETWRIGDEWDETSAGKIIKYSPDDESTLQKQVMYMADSEQSLGNMVFSGKTRPSIFMPRWASRIDLEIVNVRVERLQDISEDDAISEGIEGYDSRVGDDYQDYWRDYSINEEDNEGFNYFTDPIKSYRSLWESINGPGSWDANPWVWVVEFKRI